MQMLVALSIANEILQLTQHITWLYGRSHFDARPSASCLRKNTIYWSDKWSERHVLFFTSWSMLIFLLNLCSFQYIHGIAVLVRRSVSVCNTDVERRSRLSIPKPHELKDLQLMPGIHFLHLVLLRQVLFSHLSTKLKQDRPLRLLFRCVVVLPVRRSCKKVHAVSQNLVDIHRISRKNVWVVFCTWYIDHLWTLWLTYQNYLSTRAAKLATRNNCCRLFSGSLVSDLLVKLQAIHRVYLCPQQFVSIRGFSCFSHLCFV